MGGRGGSSGRGKAGGGGGGGSFTVNKRPWTEHNYDLADQMQKELSGMKGMPGGTISTSSQQVGVKFNKSLTDKQVQTLEKKGYTVPTKDNAYKKTGQYSHMD